MEDLLYVKKWKYRVHLIFLHFIKPQLCLFLVIQTKLDSSTNLLKAGTFIMCNGKLLLLQDSFLHTMNSKLFSSKLIFKFSELKIKYFLRPLIFFSEIGSCYTAQARVQRLFIGTIIVHYSLGLLSSKGPPVSTS